LLAAFLFFQKYILLLHQDLHLVLWTLQPYIWVECWDFCANASANRQLNMDLILENKCGITSLILRILSWFL
jgi:hypothetical protein